MDRPAAPDIRPSDNREDRHTRDETYGLSYFDTCSWLSFIFIRWPSSWMRYFCSAYIGPEDVHPLPKADSVDYWQPIFSKHISDGLLRLEKSDVEAASGAGGRRTRPYKSIIVRAMFLTFWKRFTIIILAHIAMNLISVGTAMLLKGLMGYMSAKENSIHAIVGMICVIVAVEFVSAVLSQHLSLYFNRVHVVMESVLTVTLFQHGMCHRRAYASLIEDLPEMTVCKGLVHSWPCKQEQCASNPLLCPARRYQNKELPPNMYVYLFVDAYAIVRIANAMVDMVRFICVFIFSIYLIGSRIGMNVLGPASIVLSIVFVLTVVEATNGYVWYYALQSKDDRVARTSEAVANLNVLRVMGMEDVGYNLARNSREDEMMLLKTRNGLHTVSLFLNRILGVSVLLFILLDYIKNLKASINDANFDISAPITMMFIVDKIASASENLPKTIKTIVESATSVTRVEKFLRTCSPNYYLKSTSGSSATMGSDLSKLSHSKEEFPPDTVVMFKDASFTWHYDRKEMLNSISLSHAIFQDLDFELKGGDINIITGAQGCGKTSFIKSILGEMSLVSGSMAVAPLSTGMPIFYTPQEVWIPTGTIRSIITFGYAFNEDIYRRVVEAVELLSDFNSWADGDSRVVSEKGYSLSGGQRVRLSLARAIYAYMVFSKANESLEENRCCFLMCLDEPFNGLDQTVTKSIFNNLFNRETGLLVSDNVSVVMAMSKMNLDILINAVDATNLKDIFVRAIEHRSLAAPRPFQSYNFDESPISRSSSYASRGRSVSKHDSLCRLPDAIWRSCEDDVSMSKENYHITRRMKGLNSRFTDDNAEQKDLCSTGHGYLTYALAIGIFLSSTIFIMFFSGSVLEKVNAIWVARWSDSVKSLGGADRATLNKEAIIEEHDYTIKLVTTFSSLFMGLIFLGVTLTAVASIISAIYLHDFALNSLFFKSSSVITVKKSIGQLLTFLATDLVYIDLYLVYFGLSTLLAFLKLLAQFATVCYTIPISIPVPVIGGIVIYFCLLQRYLVSSKKGQLLMLEGVTNISSVYANVIDGSSMYRSYQKEKYCMKSIVERSDYYYRSKFIKAAFTSRFMIETKITTCVMLFVVALLPVLYSYFMGTALQVAKVGLGISISMAINGALTACISNWTTLEKSMCSMSRYESYFLQGKFSLKEKFENMHETVLCGRSIDDTGTYDKKRRADLVKRRKLEFCNYLFRRYRSVLSTLFYKPRIEFLDGSAYMPAEYSSVVLEDVSVPHLSKQSGDSQHYILKGISARANAGDIIGIMGRTGAGKSTLLAVLQNISRMREGDVLLDGRDLNTIPRKVLRHVIGVLPQIPFIFKGWTLRRFLDPRMLYSDSEIMTALECCGLLDLVNSLPCEKPLDAIMVANPVKAERGLFLITPLIKISGAEETGVDLHRTVENSRAEGEQPKSLFSMTQLRMLSLARLILYRSTYRILLIDEPPREDNKSSDDKAAASETEARPSTVSAALPVYELVKIYFKHCTTFIVAHDKTVLSYCSKLWEMNGGMLVKNKEVEAGDIETFLS
ncbi:ABC transporter family protein [Babesia caballi]|uniref:ABC transporter family protein n=1 Tax=Babesia caballi TaxID=5871 RepID=A0AAV4LNR7_BABCB|nr:ABC transporter family protein [Babesia caballi]